MKGRRIVQWILGIAAFAVYARGTVMIMEALPGNVVVWIYYGCTAIFAATVVLYVGSRSAEGTVEVYSKYMEGKALPTGLWFRLTHWFVAPARRRALFIAAVLALAVVLPAHVQLYPDQGDVEY